MKKKTKKILIIALSVLLVGLVGAMGAIFGKTDWNNLKNKVNEIINQEEIVETKNLIYNSDFSINTSGKTVFSSEDGVAIGTEFFDGWFDNRGTSTDYTLYSTTSGMYAKIGEDAGTRFDIVQHISSSEGLIDNVYTMAISINDVVYSKTFTLVQGEFVYLDIEPLAVTMTLASDNGFLRQFIGLQPGFEGIVNWIQLEEGNIFTGYAQGPLTYSNPLDA